MKMLLIRAAAIGSILSGLLFVQVCNAEDANVRAEECALGALRGQLRISTGKLRGEGSTIYGFSAEGGRLTKYFRGDELVRIRAHFFGESGQVIVIAASKGGAILADVSWIDYSRPLPSTPIKIARRQRLVGLSCNGEIQMISESGVGVFKDREQAFRDLVEQYPDWIVVR